MAELLRNYRDFQVEDPYTKKMVRGMDPEVHIRRLQHFGEGAGMDLAGVDRTKLQPKHFQKELMYGSRLDHLSFDIHDEGLHIPRPLLYPNIYGNQTLYGVSNRGTFTHINHESPYTYGELTHRTPYTASVHDDSKGVMTGAVYKDFYDPNGPTFDDIHTYWNMSDNPSDAIGADGLKMSVNSKSIRSAIDEAQKAFRVVNSRRGPVPKEAQEEVEHLINNPDPRLVNLVRRNIPHALSSQFVQVTHAPQGDSGKWVSDDKLVSDVIDLETGNWAKIDPEGFFPD